MSREIIGQMSLLNKEIEYNLPSAEEINTRMFSKVLDDKNVVASYKLYWLLGILDEVSAGNNIIEFKRIISRMITYSWYPLLKYKLSFGYSDNLKKPVNYMAEKYNLPSNHNSEKLLDFIYKSNDKELLKMIKELGLYVPYRLITPFYAEELKGIKDKSKNKYIEYLSQNTSYAVYKIINGDTIVINEGWDDYLRDNYKIIKSWIYYKLVMFLQKRNPNVPAIALKLEAPIKRELETAKKLWKGIIFERDIKDIYTGNEFNDMNYEKYGVLSIDHFIPWSFVLHDKMWNLTPTFKNINSSKSDNLLDCDAYIDLFCNVQYEAFAYMCDKKKNKDLEEYMDILQLENPYEYYKYSNKIDFSSKLKQNIAPVYQIAINQGFTVMDRL
ncbi:HNH endonuclease [Clostridium cavendishii DSM 21758]|uniref:HNH endonuclease n=1 Tax=Clostridium cavendishii DSM 21758 TaxID=1121302 RepID=A0A1M6GMR1_9CLOT|nr:HNH endonuclease domain-containing protein [Clostridium cavendishii]SHJ11156.1 HNH endonuclease [Clostridium cavendishii DSM 21758]